MKKIGYVIIFGVLSTLGLSAEVNAQELASTGYNPNSVYPIHESNIMFKKTLWRRDGS